MYLPPQGGTLIGLSIRPVLRFSTTTGASAQSGFDIEWMMRTPV
jgi:hypothetical protein